MPFVANISIYTYTKAFLAID